jgi:hypothetical protein
VQLEYDAQIDVKISAVRIKHIQNKKNQEKEFEVPSKEELIEKYKIKNIGDLDENLHD